MEAPVNGSNSNCFKVAKFHPSLPTLMDSYVGDKTSLRLELGGGLDTLGSEQTNTRFIQEVLLSQILVIPLTL